MEWQEEYPGLFSTKPEWARASDYELLEKSGRLYVVPAKDAEVEYYRPFECYLDILEAFIKMAKSIREINSQFNEWSRNLTSEPDRNEYLREQKKRDHKEGIEIIRFARRYGLLGVFFDSYHEIYNEPICNPDKSYEFISTVLMTGRGRVIVQDGPYADSHINGRSCEYSHFARMFFPRLKASYPIPRGYSSVIDGSDKRFWNEYGERVDWVLSLCSGLYHDFLDWQEWIDAEKLGKTLNDHPDPDAPKYQWLHKLNFLVYPVGLALDYNHRGQGSWQQMYIFNSLFSAIKIMHLRDRVDTFSKIRICDWCGEPFIAKKPTARWHGPSCANHHGVTKSRKKKKILALFKEGTTIEDIAQKVDVDIKWIAEWLDDWSKEEG